ncbi:ATP cone domain-containing protein, partial [uncultured Bifidobacterium sp.]
MTDSVKERGISDRDAVDGILVEKRDGRIVDFDPVNIMNAIEAAFKDVKHEVSPEDRQQIRGMALTVQSEIT